MKLLLTNPDLIYADSWPLPRFGPRTFFLSLQAIIKSYYGFETEHIFYGKPNKITFDFAE